MCQSKEISHIYLIKILIIREFIHTTIGSKEPKWVNELENPSIIIKRLDFHNSGDDAVTTAI